MGMFVRILIASLHKNQVVREKGQYAIGADYYRNRAHPSTRHLRRANLILLSIILCQVFTNELKVAADQATETNKLFGAVSSQNSKKSDDALKLKIKNAIDASSHFKKNLRGIIDEVTRQNYTTVMQPNVIGTTVIPSVPTQIPLGGYLPPRQQYMTFFAAQSKLLLKTLVETDSALLENEDEDAVISAQLAQTSSGLGKLQGENEKLKSLLSHYPYDNLAIGKQALRMSDELDKIEKLLKKSEKRRKKITRKD
jgi:hypothetical protein